MSSKEPASPHASTKHRSPKLAAEAPQTPALQQLRPAAFIQKARLDPRSLTPGDVVQLQRLTGNQAVSRLLARPPQRPPIENEHNGAGLPGSLKSGIEYLSGLSMEEVRVHYNSPRPDEVQALAYTQGADIHVAKGQEKHLAHEAWHVVQQKQGRVKPTLQLKGKAISEDPGLETEADVMGERAKTAQRQTQAETRSGDPLSHSPIQRVKGIKVRTPVEVHDGGPTWYGEVEKVLENAYEIRVGGTEHRVKVPEAQVEFHPSLRAHTYQTLSVEAEDELKQLGVSEERAAELREQAKSIADRTGYLERARRDWNSAITPDIREKISKELHEQQVFVARLPSLDIKADRGKFAAEGALANAIVEGQKAMEGGLEKDTAKHTIAMFKYMSDHADALAGLTNTHFTTITADKPVLRHGYLESLSAQLAPKLGDRTLWGDYDRGQVVGNSMDAGYWFKQGKAALLEKAGGALQAGRTLTALLKNHSDNMEAKSYGRRVMSMLVLQIEDLPSPQAQVVKPQPNMPVAYATPGYVYYGEYDYERRTELQPGTLEEGKDYLLYINMQTLVSVTVKANNEHDRTLTFESVQ